jgi:hypothetical protein
VKYRGYNGSAGYNGIGGPLIDGTYLQPCHWARLV